MTAHPIDTEAFLWLDRLDDAVKRRAYDCACQVGGVDAMSIDTDWLRHALSEIRRAHRKMSERVGVAEHRATRAEAQSAIRGRAVQIYQQRARTAAAERDYRKRENAELRDELVATQEFGAKMAHDRESAIYDLDDAEARIKAVRELHTPFEDRDCGTVCAECSYFGGDYGLYPTDYPCDTIRALDGTVTPPDAG